MSMDYMNTSSHIVTDILVKKTPSTTTKKVTMNGNTSGEVDVFSWRQYSLGAFVFLIVLIVILINAVFLICFYRLRNCTFVQNSQALICLIASDLVKALIYIPTLVSWFVVQESYTYATCVFIPFSFLLTNYTSLLHITAFCIWRLIAAKYISDGRTKFKSSWYVFASLALTIVAILLNLIPYFIFKDTDVTVMNCKRVLLKHLQGRYLYFAVLFDTPIMVMNITVIILFVWYKRFDAKVGCCPEEVFPDISQNVYRFETSNTIRTITDINLLTMNEFKRIPKSETSPFTLDTSIIEDLESDPSLAGITDSDEQRNSSENKKNKEIIFQSNEFNRRTVATERSQKKTSFSAWLIQHTRVFPMLQSEAGESSIPDTRVVSQPQGNSKRATTVNILPNNMCETISADRHTTTLHGMKQFLVTIGILVGFYNISILPLLLVLNYGTNDLSVYMTPVVGRLCFLTSLINPVVYLFRIGKLWKEIKVLLNCGRNYGTDSQDTNCISSQC